MTVVIKAKPDEVRRLAAEGHSQSTIASMLGVSRERIRQICDRDGIETLSGKVDYDRRDKLAVFAGVVGVSAGEAARLAGYRNQSVFHRAGLALPRLRKNSDKYRECAESGMTLTETARLFGASVPQVWNECRRDGVEFTARGKRKVAYRHWTPEDRVKLARLVADGSDLASIAEEFGVSVGALRHQIAKAVK